MSWFHWETSVNKVLTPREGQVPVELDLKMAPGPPSLSSSPLGLLFLPDLLIWTIIWHFTVWRLICRNSFSPNIRSHCVRWTQTKSKMVAKWKMLHEAFALCNVIEKQSKWRRFAHKLPRLSVIDVFLAEKYQVHTMFQARSKDQEILEEGGGAGPSSYPEEIMSREVARRSWAAN